MNVLVDARVLAGSQGGIQQAIMVLAAGLSSLNNEGDRFHFLCYPDEGDWLRPYLGDSCELVTWRGRKPHGNRNSTEGTGLAGRLRELAKNTPLVSRTVPFELEESDGTAEAIGADVVHFPTQRAFRTRVPSIYQPHDLQHLHLPELFSRRDREYRSWAYGLWTAQATVVLMMSRWGKRDIVRSLGIDESKVCVVPWAPATPLYAKPDLERCHAVRQAHSLPSEFVLYPAQTWPHKNHLMLVEALAALRQQGITVPLVCTGRTTKHLVEIMRRIDELGLEDQVHFLGFVGPTELRVLYRLARCVVFPSLFEGFGLPIAEAFAEGVPVTATSATCIPELAGDAVVYFDPRDAVDIAKGLRRIWGDTDLRERLVAAGRKRALLYSPKRSARSIKALYRQLAGHSLSARDRLLLSEAFGSIAEEAGGIR